MKTYEITFIAQEDLKDKPIKTVLTALSGKLLDTTSIGEKQFAYKIKKETRGFYTTVLFELEPEKIPELNKKLAQEEEILRFIIVAKKPSQLLAAEVKPEKMFPAEPKKIEAPIEIEPLKELEKPKEIKPEKPAKKAVKTETPKIKPKKTKEVTEIETETESEEDRLEALDKKLDELLKE